MTPVVDVTLLGATGFTGGLTADHIGTHLPLGASWAVAGRSRERLDAVADRVEGLGGVRPAVVQVDLDDLASLAALAAGTRVLVTTVGPYLQHGHPVVAAAVDAGIGYVDLTGEPQFVDEVYVRHHARAVETGAVIVHACGFDSVPYDLGVLHAVQQLPEDVPISVRGYIRASGRASGGTVHSAVNQLGSMRAARAAGEARRAREPRPAGRRVKGGGKLGRAPELGGWGVPLPTIDPQIVLRSARALDRYGPDFSYQHFAHVRKRRTIVAAAVGAGVVVAGAQLPPTRTLLLRLADPGTGPSEEKRARSWFTYTAVAEGGGRTVTTRVRGGDPGYGETATMLGQAALCLAFDDVPTRVPGQTTTAVAMGDPLISRLRAAGISFESS